MGVINTHMNQLNSALAMVAGLYYQSVYHTLSCTVHGCTLKKNTYPYSPGLLLIEFNIY